MNHATETKKLNNNGFSLVELIIVVAIMAVLVGVLAPQYLKYVESARYQADMTMVNSVKDAIEVAISSSEDVNLKLTGDTITFSGTNNLNKIGWDELDAELQTVLAYESNQYTDTRLTSRTCTTAGASVTLTIDGTTGSVTLSAPAAP